MCETEANARTLVKTLEVYDIKTSFYSFTLVRGTTSLSHFLRLINRIIGSYRSTRFFFTFDTELRINSAKIQEKFKTCEMLSGKYCHSK
jgi:hypothetical protein